MLYRSTKPGVLSATTRASSQSWFQTLSSLYKRRGIGILYSALVVTARNMLRYAACDARTVDSWDRTGRMDGRDDMAVSVLPACGDGPVVTCDMG